MRVPPARSVALASALVAAGPATLAAQGPTFEAAYGPWFAINDSVSQVFHAGVTYHLGLFGMGFDVVHLADDASAADRTLTGGEVSVRLGREGTGPYAIAGVGVGLRHANGNADAFWTAGGGFAVRLVSSLAIGAEVRYRLEDTRIAGFWHRADTDREGMQVQLRVSFGIPRGSRAPRGVGTGSPSPRPGDPVATARANGATENAARLTASVVETALGVMGTPYQWGGTDDNGFDCSGLIQYAYGQQGIVLPRISRDQMRMGTAVARNVAALRPGDILGFSAERSSQITHVGLYVGDGRFIHSSSSGVKLSSLRSGNGDSRWWRDRWVGARRIVE